MKRITKGTRQIQIFPKEVTILRKEFETAFVALDRDNVDGDRYSGITIAARFPLLWQLFCLI